MICGATRYRESAHRGFRFIVDVNADPKQVGPKSAAVNGRLDTTPSAAQVAANMSRPTGIIADLEGC